MSPTGRTRRRPETRPRHTPEVARQRLTAHIYGTILALAALAATSVEQVFSCQVVAVVVVIGFSFFVAHLFADFVGSQIDEGESTDSSEPFRMLRESLPILSAITIPMLLLTGSWLDLIDPTLALRGAQLYAIVRIALTGFFVSKYQRRPATGATWLTCLLLAVLATAVVALKIALGHG